MSSSSVYSIKLPYLGVISLGKSPLNLKSFQKPLRELYIPYYHERSHDERRMVISDCDILIFESDVAVKGKRAFIYSNFESIVDIQILKLSFMIHDTENQQHKRIQTAFLPIGCEQQERFHSLYSSINKSQYNLLSTSTSCHPSLLLFVIRKPGVGESCSLLDCHVFAAHRESIAFELCDMIRKLIIKQTMSPLLPRKTTLVHTQNHNKEKKFEKQIKYLRRDRPTSTMEHRQIDKQNNHLVSNVNLNDVVHSIVNTFRNPLSSSSLERNNVQNSSHDTSKVLTTNSDIHRMSSKQRHFIKASTLIRDESDEVVNDLMNIVANEKLKSQVSIKRHASFDQTSCSEDYTMSKKRFFHNKKRVAPIIHNPPRIDGHLLRPHIVVNRYGDIGNYVPKFLRENITMRSSDSNENIFFRSTNGQLLNGFLKLDLLSTNNSFNENNHYQSSPCLNQDQNIFSLVQQLRKNQTKSFINIHRDDSNIDMETNHNDDHRVPHVLKSMGDIINDIKIHPLPHSSKPKRVASYIELPIDYRQYLRQTDQGAYLYGEERRQQQTTLEHSLGYYP